MTKEVGSLSNQDIIKNQYEVVTIEYYQDELKVAECKINKRKEARKMEFRHCSTGDLARREVEELSDKKFRKCESVTVYIGLERSGIVLTPKMICAHFKVNVKVGEKLIDTITRREEGRESIIAIEHVTPLLPNYLTLPCDGCNFVNSELFQSPEFKNEVTRIEIVI